MPRCWGCSGSAVPHRHDAGRAEDAIESAAANQGACSAVHSPRLTCAVCRHLAVGVSHPPLSRLHAIRCLIHLLHAEICHGGAACPCLVVSVAALSLAACGDVPGCCQRLRNGIARCDGIGAAGIGIDAHALHVAQALIFGIGELGGYVGGCAVSDSSKVSNDPLLGVGDHLVLKAAISRLVLVIPLLLEVKHFALKAELFLGEFFGRAGSGDAADKGCASKGCRYWVKHDCDLLKQ